MEPFTGILSHIRTVCGRLWTKVSQMATNITSDGVKFWVWWAQVGRTFNRCTTKCWWRVYRWCTCWHHFLTEVIMNRLQQKFNIQLGALHHYSSCLDWVWTIPHFISCPSQFSASSSVLEHISCLQSTMANVIKHVANTSIKLVPFILPHCGPVRARWILQSAGVS